MIVISKCCDLYSQKIQVRWRNWENNNIIQISTRTKVKLSFFLPVNSNYVVVVCHTWTVLFSAASFTAPSGATRGHQQGRKESGQAGPLGVGELFSGKSWTTWKDRVVDFGPPRFWSCRLAGRKQGRCRCLAVGDAWAVQTGSFSRHRWPALSGLWSSQTRCPPWR